MPKRPTLRPSAGRPDEGDDARGGITSAKAARLPGWTVGTSVLVHALLVGVVAWAAYRSLHRDTLAAAPPSPAPVASVIPIELPGVAEGTLLSDSVPDPKGEVPPPPGGATVAHVDTGVAGRGGERAGERATHLADSDSKLSRTQDLMDRLERDQALRIKTNDTVRQTREDRRQSRDPMELTFVANGTGQLDERRDRAGDPSRGVRASRPAALEGGQLGSPTLEGDNGARPGAAMEGALAASSGVGARNARPGADHHPGANPRTARPMVELGTPSIPADTRGRPQDTVDSAQDVSNVLRSLVHASATGGAGGDGPGGSPGPGDPGAGGLFGAGAHPKPLGSGTGDFIDYDTHDPRYVTYFRRIHGKIDPLLRGAFPESAVKELKQGTVILVFTVERSGAVRVSWPPARPSGIEEFDKNAADAIRRASPLPPVPPELETPLRIRAPISDGAAVSWAPRSR
ncbi:MAG: TonB family protein [Myxococcales bacterium]|nr:TonB family protein [Myxococcales bacterium]